jgi:hypothetical protein
MEVVIVGKVKELKGIETFDSGFQKRQIVVTELEGNYPQDIAIDFVKEGITKLENVKVGEKVEIKANLRGSEFGGKNYVSLQGWFFKSDAPKSAF